MPRYPKPFFRKSRQLWYVQLAGRQVNLGPDRDAAFAADSAGQLAVVTCPHLWNQVLN
jgi:hypothetical protein